MINARMTNDVINRSRYKHKHLFLCLNKWQRATKQTEHTHTNKEKKNRCPIKKFNWIARRSLRRDFEIFWLKSDCFSLVWLRVSFISLLLRSCKKQNLYLWFHFARIDKTQKIMIDFKFDFSIIVFNGYVCKVHEWWIYRISK